MLLDVSGSLLQGWAGYIGLGHIDNSNALSPSACSLADYSTASSTGQTSHHTCTSPLPSRVLYTLRSSSTNWLLSLSYKLYTSLCAKPSTSLLPPSLFSSRSSHTSNPVRPAAVPRKHGGHPACRPESSWGCHLHPTTPCTACGQSPCGPHHSRTCHPCTDIPWRHPACPCNPWRFC